jgi:tripartite-type tricarboxylate transporter receptor subunit TctC
MGGPSVKCLLVVRMLLAIMALYPFSARASYPEHAIVLIVPFAAGGPTDIVARIFATGMSRSLGQLIVVENVVGAGGATAALRAMRAAPDGYTILMGHMGTHAAAVAINPSLPYDPRTDFTPIGITAGMPVVALIRQGLPAHNLLAFADYVRANGAAVKMAHAGIGSVSYTTCLMLNRILDVKPTLVAFQGTAPAMNALISGDIDYMCDQIVSAVPQVRAGTILALAVATPKRNATMPGVPTAREAGVPAFDASAWNALFAPSKTPPAIIEKLNAALQDTLNDPEAHKQLVDLGADLPDVEGRTPEALAALVKSEIAKWTAIIQAVPPISTAARVEASVKADPAGRCRSIRALRGQEPWLNHAQRASISSPACSLITDSPILRHLLTIQYVTGGRSIEVDPCICSEPGQQLSS